MTLEHLYEQTFMSNESEVKVDCTKLDPPELSLSFLDNNPFGAGLIS